jgi:hypothetical protein
MGHGNPAGKVMSWVAVAVLLGAVSLLAGCKIPAAATAASTPPPASSRAVTTPRPDSPPTAPGVPIPAIQPTMVTTVAETLFSNGGLLVVLTTMTITRDHEVTAHVSYENAGSTALGLYCSGASNPAIDTLTAANGTVIPASHTYCSDHARATIDVPPGETLPSYAVFEGIRASSGPFTLTWQKSSGISGAVSGITLR